MSTITQVINDGQITISDDNGNSEILGCASGDFSYSALTPDGKATVAVGSRGSFCALRKGERVPVTGSFSLFTSNPNSDFAKLANGTTAGTISTAVVVGDLHCVDLEFDFTYLAETRQMIFDDVHMVADGSEGDPSTTSYSWTGYGRVRIIDAVGTTTPIAGL